MIQPKMADQSNTPDDQQFPASSMSEMELNATDDQGNTPLILAVSEGNIARVQELLSQTGINVNAKNKSHNTALAQAVKIPLASQNPGIFTRLLEHPDIDVNITDRYQATVLHTAVDKHLTEAIRALLHHSDTDPSVRDVYDSTPFTSLLSNSSPGDEDMEIVGWFLNHPKLDVNFAGENEKTPLMCTAQYSCSSAMQKILQHPKVKINAQDGRGKTALMHLMQVSEPDQGCLDLLLNSPDLDINMKNDYDDSALQYCTHRESLSKLLNHPRIDMHQVQKGQHHDLTKFRSVFLKAHYYDDYEEMADELSRHPKFKVNAVRGDGHTDLTWAADQGQDMMFRYLLKHPEIQVSQCNGHQMSPLQHLAQNFSIKLIQELISHSDFKEQDLGHQDAEGKTFLHHLFQHKAGLFVQSATIPDMEFIATLIEKYDTNLTVVDKKGYTALMCAIEFARGKVPVPTGLPEAINNILKKSSRADLEQKNIYNMSALDMVRENSSELDEKIRFIFKPHLEEEKSVISEDLPTAECLRLLRRSLHGLKLPQDMREHLLQQVDKLESDADAFTGGRYGHELGMKKVHRDKLQGMHVFLLQNLHTNEVIPHLYAAGILTDDMKEGLSMLGLRSQVATKLLSILPTRGPEAYDTFIQALNATGQEAIARALEEYQPQATSDKAKGTMDVSHCTEPFALAACQTSPVVTLNVTPGRPVALTFMVRASEDSI